MKTDRTPRDAGSAMILVLMVMALIAALGSTVAMITISDLQSSRRAAEAGQVLNAAEAGLAQAVTYIRENGVRDLRCRKEQAPTASECARAYGSGYKIGPQLGSKAPAVYQVWVEEVVRHSPRLQQDGVYLVHSTGALGDPERARRSITVKVQVRSFGVPRAVFAREVVPTGNGNPKLIGQSIFTSTCFTHRNQLTVSGTDPFLGIPAAVHSSKVITTGGQNQCDADPSNNKAIHAGGQACNSNFRNDQDVMGGAIPTSCTSAVTEFPEYYGPRCAPLTSSAVCDDPVYGSRIHDQSGWQAAFGFNDQPLSGDQLERLRALADDSFTLRKNTTAWPTGVTNSSEKVFFFDFDDQMTGSRKVDLSGMPLASSIDPCKPPIVVIRNGDAELKMPNDSAVLNASVFLVTESTAYGMATLYKGTLQGALFANSLNLQGGPTLGQADCAVDATLPQVLDIAVSCYTEDDRASRKCLP